MDTNTVLNATHNADHDRDEAISYAHAQRILVAPAGFVMVSQYRTVTTVAAVKTNGADARWWNTDVYCESEDARAARCAQLVEDAKAMVLAREYQKLAQALVKLANARTCAALLADDGTLQQYHDAWQAAIDALANAPALAKEFDS